MGTDPRECSIPDQHSHKDYGVVYPPIVSKTLSNRGLTMLGRNPTEMRFLGYTATQAEEDGWIVDRSCYPWVAYVGARFDCDAFVFMFPENNEQDLPVYETITEYTVIAVPENLCLDAPMWAVKVEYRGDDRWAVCFNGRCFDAEGERDWEPQPSSREDEWLDRFRHTKEEALAIARKVAPTIKINGLTPADLIAKYSEP